MPQTMHTITPLITSQLNHKLNFYTRKQEKLDQVWKKKIRPKQCYSPFVSLYVFLIIHLTKKPNSVYSNSKMAQNLFSVAASASFCFFQSPLFFLSLSVILSLYSLFSFLLLTFSLSYYKAPYHLIHMTGNSAHPRVTGHSTHTIGVVPTRVHHGQILMTATTSTHRCCR